MRAVPQDLSLRRRVRGGDIGPCHRQVEQPLDVQESAARSGIAGRGGGPPARPFAANFEQLIHGKQGIVAALPKSVADWRAARMVVHVYFHGGEREGRVWKFTRDDFLRRG